MELCILTKVVLIGLVLLYLSKSTINKHNSELCSYFDINFRVHRSLLYILHTRLRKQEDNWSVCCPKEHGKGSLKNSGLICQNKENRAEWK